MCCKTFIGIMLLFTASCVTGKKIKVGKMNITYGAFKPFANKNLKGAKILTKPAETLPECVQKCEEHKNCTSANFNEKECDLLSDNKHVSEEKFETLSGSIHVAKMNRGCDEKKCHNNATCVPDYEENTYSCNCKREYTGKLCEVLLESPIPAWWFKFDGGTENDGLKTSDATVNAQNTGENKAIFIGKTHKKGKYMECHSQCTTSTISYPGWSNPEKFSFSFALWIQFPPEHEVHQDSFKSAVQIFFAKIGVVVNYFKPQRVWIFEMRLASGYLESRIPLSLEEMKNWNFIAMSWRAGIRAFECFVNNNKTLTKDQVSRAHTKTPNSLLFHPYKNTIVNIDEFRVWYQGDYPRFIQQLYNKEKNDMWH